MWFYMKYIVNNYNDRILFARLCICQYIMVRTSYIRWDDNVLFVLTRYTVLAYWKNSPRVDLSLH